MARRIQEQTLHMGPVAYLHARGLTDLDYPVLVRPMDAHYDYVVARIPSEDDLGMFYRVWNPTRAMREVAHAAFGTWYTDRPGRITRDRDIWYALRYIHRLLTLAPQATREQGRDVMGRIAQYLGERAGGWLPSSCLAVVAEYFHYAHALVLPNHRTASFCAATLLLMLGVPRDRVAVFGLYYQDPTVYYSDDNGWYGGLLYGTPHMTMLGLLTNGRWIPIDVTLLADTPIEAMTGLPAPFVRDPYLGRDPQTGARLIIDYAHPYTMVFAPPPPWQDNPSASIARIPLLQF